MPGVKGITIFLGNNKKNANQLAFFCFVLRYKVNFCCTLISGDWMHWLIEVDIQSRKISSPDPLTYL